MKNFLLPLLLIVGLASASMMQASTSAPVANQPQGLRPTAFDPFSPGDDYAKLLAEDCDLPAAPAGSHYTWDKECLKGVMSGPAFISSLLEMEGKVRDLMGDLQAASDLVDLTRQNWLNGTALGLPLSELQALEQAFNDALKNFSEVKDTVNAGIVQARRDFLNDMGVCDCLVLVEDN